MTVIKQDDLIQSVADALQFISYYHPVDFIQAMHEAYLREESPAARDSIAQILINSRMCATGHRPICQDTGIVTVFVRVGMDVRWDGATMSLDDMINEGVRRAYNLPENVLRASILADPAGARKNTKDNTPAVIHYSIVPGNTVEVDVAAKGGGSENKSKMAMLNPSDSIVDWVLKTVPTMGAGWCPPGMLGIGIGGTAEKAAVMAKEVLMESIDIHELKARGPQNRIEELRLELFEKVNQLGIGAQGLGGLTTVLDVKIMDYPTHAASLPVCMIPNCAATRHAHFVLDGSGPASLEAPSLDAYPEIVWEAGPSARRVNLDTLTPEEVQSWKPGETVLLNGKMLTGRDAAHKRMVEMLNKGETLPVDLKGRFIYYVGPVDPVRRSGWPGWPDHRHADGQVHPPDPRANRPAGHDRQIRARPDRHRSDQGQQGRVPDGRGRRCLPGGPSHQEVARGGLRRTGHGSDLRVRGQRHAGHRRGGQQRRVRPHHRSCHLAEKDQ
jgi:fumarate hydratase class I